jgi:hypothetical protein
MGIAEIKKTASPSFYDGLENMKEVQMNTSSMSFKSIHVDLHLLQTLVLCNW